MKKNKYFVFITFIILLLASIFYFINKSYENFILNDDQKFAIIEAHLVNLGNQKIFENFQSSGSGSLSNLTNVQLEQNYLDNLNKGSGSLDKVVALTNYINSKGSSGSTLPVVNSRYESEAAFPPQINPKAQSNLTNVQLEVFSLDYL